MISEYAGTANLDAVADEAHARWAMHWAACYTRRRTDIDSWCQACDDLDLAANRAESIARQARQQTAAVGA